jgi:L-ribulose-5-phosphate 3-epimerase
MKNKSHCKAACATTELSPFYGRLGVRAHDFGRLSADALAFKISARGLVCTQLALSKAIAGLDLKPGQLNPGLAFDIGQAFLRQGVQIAVLGCYINPLHPDLVTRQGLLDWFKEHLRFARDFGCGLVALETGSLNADYSPHSGNHGEAAWKQCLASLATLVEEAERFGVMVGIEGVTHHVVSTPARMRAMLDALCSPNVQVVFDPVNFLSPENYGDQDRVIRESIDLFGDRIVAIHAKDFVVDEGVFTFARSGQGQFHHQLLFDFISNQKPGISVLLEETNENTVSDSIRFIRGLNS